jgi:hypothetical protein
MSTSVPRGVDFDVLLRLAEIACEKRREQGPLRTWRVESPPSSRAAGMHLTTDDMCHEVIKPATAEFGCAFSDTLDAGLICPSDILVSHVWTYSFEDVVDSLKPHAGSGTYVWFDLALNSQ